LQRTSINWLAVELKVCADHVSAVSDALIDHGALSVDVSDAEAGTAQEASIFDESGEYIEAAFGINRLVALFAAPVDVSGEVKRAFMAAGLSDIPEYTISEIPEQNWVKLTQQQFSPIRISNRLWIVPSWHALPNPGAINIVLDPGLAFGTGSHPSTRLCLDWLDKNILPGCSVIDYGCGSGVLAITAAKLGAGNVRGVDIDPQAVILSRSNAKRNGVRAEFSGADERAPAAADIVMANILANPLKVLAPLLAKLTLPGGQLVLSGVLPQQVPDVAEAYRAWFIIDPPVMEEGWARLRGIRMK
jgi:ribosomal protein L11 methyltransferase